MTSAAPPPAVTERQGLVVRGHRVASGLGGDRRFPAGTIALQLPIFRDLVPALEAHLGGPAHPGTINLRLAGARRRILRPEIILEHVRWTPLFPPETFYLSRAELVHDGREHPVFLYIPDPATKPDHHQASNVIELLARRIEGLEYGDAATLRFRPDAIAI